MWDLFRQHPVLFIGHFLWAFFLPFVLLAGALLLLNVLFGPAHYTANPFP